MTTCKGRLAIIELPDKTPIGFVRRAQDKKPILFSLPKACGGSATDTGLCLNCIERETKTAAAVAKAGGKYVANQQTLLHGRFGEALPPWSHMYGSRWFCETQAEKELEVPEVVLRFLGGDAAPPSKPEAVASVEKMAPRKKAAEPLAQTPEAPPQPKKRAPKKVGTKAEPSAQTATPAEHVAPAPAATPAPKKFAPKKKAAAPAVAQAPPTIGVVDPKAPALGEIEVVKISVRKITIDDRSVYLSAEKDKVYDLKFKYIGRYNRREDCIESKYPDSDSEKV